MWRYSCCRLLLPFQFDKSNLLLILPNFKRYERNTFVLSRFLSLSIFYSLLCSVHRHKSAYIFLKKFSMKVEREFLNQPNFLFFSILLPSFLYPNQMRNDTNRFVLCVFNFVFAILLTKREKKATREEKYRFDLVLFFYAQMFCFDARNVLLKAKPNDAKGEQREGGKTSLQSINWIFKSVIHLVYFICTGTHLLEFKKRTKVLLAIILFAWRLHWISNLSHCIHLI